MHWNRQAQQNKPPTESHWMHILHQSFGAILRFVRWRPAASGMDTPVRGKQWNVEAKKGGKKKKGGKFFDSSQMFRGEPYPPTPWMEMLQVKHKIQNIEMLKNKGLNWIAWSQADWQCLSGNHIGLV